MPAYATAGPGASTTEGSTWAWSLDYLDPLDKLVLLAVLEDTPTDTLAAFDRLPQLARLTGLGVQAVQAALLSLQRAGLLWGDA